MAIRKTVAVWGTSLLFVCPAYSYRAPAVRASDAGSVTPGCGGKVRAKLIILKPSKTSRGDSLRIMDALRAVRGAIAVEGSEDAEFVSLIVPEDNPMTPERAVKFLSLAGYEVSTASDAEFEMESTRLQSKALTISVSSVSESEATTKPDASATKNRGANDASAITSLGESIAALGDHFNQAKGRYRFVALLSPT